MSDECGNCKFWVKRSDRAGEMGGGFCRRYPPAFPSETLVFATGDRGPPPPSPFGLHPLVAFMEG